MKVMSERMVKNYTQNTTLSFWILLTRLIIYFGECMIHLYLARSRKYGQGFLTEKDRHGSNANREDECT